MNKAYHHLLSFLFLLFLIPCAAQKRFNNGNFVSKIDGINISYTIKGKEPVMIVGHPTSGKIGYELSLKLLENKFTIVYYDPREKRSVFHFNKFFLCSLT